MFDERGVGIQILGLRIHPFNQATTTTKLLLLASTPYLNSGTNLRQQDLITIVIIVEVSSFPLLPVMKTRRMRPYRSLPMCSQTPAWCLREEQGIHVFGADSNEGPRLRPIPPGRQTRHAVDVAIVGDARVFVDEEVGEGGFGGWFDVSLKITMRLVR